jgi:hypothetical protein
MQASKSQCRRSTLGARVMVLTLWLAACVATQGAERKPASLWNKKTGLVTP